MLRDGRAAGVPARIAEELHLAPKPLEVNVPPPFVLGCEQLQQRGAGQVGVKDPRPRGFPQQGDDGIAPHRHQRTTVEPGAPLRAVFAEVPLRHQDVQVAVEVQVASDG